MKLFYEKLWIHGLIVACPEGTPLVDCPLEKYRKFTLEERLKIVEELSDEEIKEIIKHHNQCDS